MDIYDGNGYLDMRAIVAHPYPFIFIHGGRGVGKTYGILKEVLRSGMKFVYTRRLQTEVDIISKEDYMPFKALMNDDPDLHIGVATISKYNSAFYYQVETEQGFVNSGPPIGYTAALSTFAHIRGFDASDVDIWIYDEFIAEAHVRPIKEEGIAFLNAYETMNRNRELQGRPPMKVVCLSNSNRLANPIYIELDLVRMAERMKKEKTNVAVDKKHGVMMVDPFDSPIAEEKADTALYRLANKNSEFYEMALGNAFSDLEQSNTGSKNLAEYRPVVTLGDLTIYKHKSDGTYYGTRHRSGNPPSYRATGVDLVRFKKDYPKIWARYLENKITFEDYTAEALFNAYLN